MRLEIDGLAEYEIGFSKVIEEIILAKKPLIGHNMFLDILFVYQQFIDDLPPSLSEFIVKVIRKSVDICSFKSYSLVFMTQRQYLQP